MGEAERNEKRAEATHASTHPRTRSLVEDHSIRALSVLWSTNERTSLVCLSLPSVEGLETCVRTPEPKWRSNVGADASARKTVVARTPNLSSLSHATDWRQNPK